ncbi:MAG: hypothetical protein NVS9B3_02200 [Gemmatimonadaceae bacterium]
MVVGATVTLLNATASASAQSGPQLLLRVDAIAARSASALGGLGVTVPIDANVRLDLYGSGGGARSVDGWRGVAGGSAVARFVLDPTRQARRGAYVGAGVSARGDELGARRGYLVVLVGLEGAQVGRVLPSLELGLGGGVNVGVVLRAARPGYR